MFSCVKFIYENSFLEYLWKERVGCALTYAIFTSVGGGPEKNREENFSQVSSRDRWNGRFFLFIYWWVGKGATPRLFILCISFYVRPKRSPVERLLNFL